MSNELIHSETQSIRENFDVSCLNVAELDRRIGEITESIYRTGRIELPDRDPRGLGAAISQDEGALLRDLVTQYKPKRTLEIGMATGLSGLHICWGLLRAGQGGVHTAIDPNQVQPEWAGLGLGLRDYAGVPEEMFNWIRGCSDQVLPQMVAQNQQYDFSFIDGNHRFEGALLDFYYIDQMTPVGGLVVFDDADWPSVRRVTRFALRHRNYEIVGGAQPDLGPLTRLWGWKNRAHRKKRFRKEGWPVEEAMHPKPYETLAMRKVSKDHREWKFWASLEN